MENGQKGPLLRVLVMRCSLTPDGCNQVIACFPCQDLWSSLSVIMSDGDDTHCHDDIEELSERIAGHVFEDGARAGVARERSTGFILKVIDGDERGKRELDFYQRLFPDNNDSPPNDLLRLRSFIPQYYGCRRYRGRTFMRLENVLHGRQSVMDIKIGRVTWDHLASQEKMEQERKKFISGDQLGFRLLGFRAVDKDGREHILSKRDAKMLTVGDVERRISFFLSPEGIMEDAKSRRDAFLHRLQGVLDFMQHQTHFKFISSSLLLSYSADQIQSSEDVAISMIDFAHTFLLPEDERCLDTNYLSGLQSFLNILSQIPL